MACRIPGEEDFGRTIDYFSAELDRLGVVVRVGVTVRDARELDAFDAVVVATGVLPRPIDLAGADLPHVVSYAELLHGAQWGERVAIIGAGGIGVDIAHLVSHRDVDFYAAYGLEPPGRRAPPRATEPPSSGAVTLMRRGTRVGERIGPSTRWAVVQELRMAGVEILTGVAYERIEPGSVLIRDAEGAERRVPADTVVIAAGQEPETALARSLAGAGRPHVVIGGAAGAAELDAERAFEKEPGHRRRSPGSSVRLGGRVAGCGLRASRRESVTRAAARLLEQHDLGDLGAALDPLDHVVDGQRRDVAAVIASISTPVGPVVRASRGQRRSAGNRDRPRLDADERQRERVTQRDQLGGALGRLDARDPRHPEHVALGRVAGEDRVRGLGRDPHDSPRHRAPLAVGFSPTSTIRARPDESRCVSSLEVTPRRRAARPRSGRGPPSMSPARSSSTGSGSPLTIASKNSLRSW